MIESLAILVVTVVVAAAAGLVIGRMIAGRIDRWQVRSRDETAEKERVDHSDSA
jgi:mannitol-specific phosphotransferase system IIBC component